MTDLLDREVEALVAARVYPSREELLSDAVRTLFRARPQLRSLSALQMYRAGEITLARAAELSGMCLEDFKHALAENGCQRDIAPPRHRRIAATDELAARGGPVKALVDADLSSILAKVDRLTLIEQLFGEGQVGLAPTVAAEL